VWVLVFGVHIAYRYAAEYVIKAPAVSDSLSLTILGVSLTPPLILSWTALILQVGLVMCAIGRMRPADVGLDLRLFGPALIALAPLWILAIVDFRGNRGLVQNLGHLAGGFLGANLLREVVFRGFLLTQIYLALGRRYREWDGGRMAWAILLSLTIADLAELSFEWRPTIEPLTAQKSVVKLGDGTVMTIEPSKANTSLTDVLIQDVRAWPHLFFTSWVFLRSGNLFFVAGMVLRYQGAWLLGRSSDFDPMTLFLQLSVILFAMEWLRFRREQAHRIDRAALGSLPLPARLADPLRAFRIYLGIMILLLFAMALHSGFAFERSEFLPVMILIWLVLPRRSTNAFYLRAFSADEGSLEIRKAILDALGPGYRLSGIRSPKRRWPILIRGLARFIFCFHYASVKHMNLEAGHGWVARLWRSLGDARCAFVDLTRVTEFVAIEIRLACQSLGLDRVLFVGDWSRSHAEWEAVVTEHVADTGQARGKVHVAVWDGSREGPSKFTDEVRQFAKGLPAGLAGLNWDAFPIVRPHVLSWARRAAQMLSVGTQLALGALLCMAGNQILRILSRDPTLEIPLGLISFTGTSLYVCCASFAYLRDNPFPFPRRAIRLYTLLVLIFTIGVTAAILYAGPAALNPAHAPDVTRFNPDLAPAFRDP
jgi:hypothetical protein